MENGNTPVALEYCKKRLHSMMTYSSCVGDTVNGLCLPPVASVTSAGRFNDRSREMKTEETANAETLLQLFQNFTSHLDALIVTD